MCCLFGIYDYGHILTAAQKKRLVSALAVASEDRGTDATGIAYNHNGHLTVYKRPYPAHLMRFKLPDDAACIMGHTRMTTQGDEKHNYNNHPFEGTAGIPFALAHNGVLYNDLTLRKDKKLPRTRIETDSYNAVMYHKALLKGERHMATKAKKKYTYLTKAIQLPDGTRKYIRGKDQKELEEKVLKAQIMVNAGVDICSEETFGHFAQMWYDIYKKPYLRENSQNAIKYVMNQHILPYVGGYRLRDISPMQIQSIMAALSDKSNSLQSKVLIALRSIFKAAQGNGLVAKSPVSSMLKPSGKKTAEKQKSDDPFGLP